MIRPLLAGMVLILGCSGTCMGQSPLTEMINAEKSFAAFTKTHTIKEGFLHYMDSAGVIFRQGKAVNARASFSKQPVGAGVLSWAPDFAVISSSGDMGVTAGPYQFRDKPGTDTPVAYGHFSSAWRKNETGEWTNRADLGVNYKVTNTLFTAIRSEVIIRRDAANTTLENMLQIDRTFNLEMSRKDVGSILSFFSEKARLMIDGFKPFDGRDCITSGLQHLPAGTRAETINGELSAAKDFAYVYGSLTNGDKKGNYLRAWILENKEWKLVLQTLHW